VHHKDGKEAEATQSRRELLRAGCGGVLAATTVAGCLGSGGSEASSNDELIIGSKNFTENIILGYMSYEVIRENTGMAVIDETNYGNNAETLDGFVQGKIHTYWDYVGTMWLVDEPQNDTPIQNPEQQYRALKEQMEAEYEMQLLDMTPFENAYVFFAEPAFISASGIETISDLAAYINSGNYDITVAIENDFAQRNDGWPELVDYYDFEAGHRQTWESQGGLTVVDVGLGYDELRFGNADIALGYSTNAQLLDLTVEFIEDDKGFWPNYNLLPVLSAEKASEEVVAELNKIPAALDSAETMQQLNARVDLDGETPEEVARSFLSGEKII
jgi:osmoprotectant transport system substrate-binding protein